MNPVGGGGRSSSVWNQVALSLRVSRQHYRVYFSNAHGEGTALARQASTDGAELIVAVGGDGTLREVVNGLDLNKNILGIIPAGTGNGFRKSCNIPGYWKAALQGLSQWSPRCIDIGQVNGVYFLNVVGVGFDAAVAQMASGKYRNLKGYLSYVAAFFEELAYFKGFSSSMECDSAGYKENETLLIVVANGSHYGGNMCIAPQASIDDSFLDVCLVKNMRLPETTMFAAQALLQKHLIHNSVIIDRAKQIHIEADANVPVHIDGDVIGVMPVKISIIPGALKLLAPGPGR